MIMLSLKQVQGNIGHHKVLHNVNIDVQKGQIVGLVGRNGAGKTTTLRTIVGLVKVLHGELTFNGIDLSRIPAHQRAMLGIGYMPEDRRLIGPLTAEENILLAAWACRHKDEKKRLGFIYELLPEVKDFAKRRAVQLSGGQQKLLALARAVMNGTNLLLLDEPFEGLAPLLVQRLSETIVTLQQQGIGILVAESDPHVLYNLTSDIYIIERGETLHKDAGARTLQVEQ